MSMQFSKEALFNVLNQAWDAHREFQKVYLEGVFDEAWPGWYAAFVIGRLGDFTTPSRLTVWLSNIPESDDWTSTATAYIFEQLEANPE